MQSKVFLNLNCVVDHRAVGIALLVVILAALLILGCWYFKKRSGYKLIRVRPSHFISDLCYSDLLLVNICKMSKWKFSSPYFKEHRVQFVPIFSQPVSLCSHFVSSQTLVHLSVTCRAPDRDHQVIQKASTRRKDLQQKTRWLLLILAASDLWWDNYFRNNSHIYRI